MGSSTCLFTEPTVKNRYHLPFLSSFLIDLQAVLHFMTGCTATEESAAVSQDVVKVLVLSGLMKWY